MKKLLLLSAMALSLVACERQQEKKPNKPETPSQAMPSRQNIIDNTTMQPKANPDPSMKNPDKTPEKQNNK